MKTWYKRIACWIPKATNTHLQCVILIAFPLRQWLLERAWILRYAHFHCPSYYIFLLFPRMWCLVVSDMIITIIKARITLCTTVHNVIRAFVFLYDEEEYPRTHNCALLKKNTLRRCRENWTELYKLLSASSASVSTSHKTGSGAQPHEISSQTASKSSRTRSNIADSGSPHNVRSRNVYTHFRCPTLVSSHDGP